MAIRVVSMLVALTACSGADADGDGVPAPVDCDDRDSWQRAPSAWYLDADGDGYGRPGTRQLACAALSGFVGNPDDCDDESATTHPAAPEICDGADNDCDGSHDELAVDAQTWFLDADGDDHGDPEQTVQACELPAWAAEQGDDCDDLEPLAWSGAEEICDGVDNDCDSQTDHDAVDAPTWYQDADGDGYGDPASPLTSCEAPMGWVENADDCDDARYAIHPGASEICDGIDNACDSLTDEEAQDAETWYQDADGDGYGDPESPLAACRDPEGYVANAADCDDGQVLAWSDGVEYCDGVDNDCDGTTDNEARDSEEWYADVDGDGYGDPDRTRLSCTQPSGYLSNDEDCDDSDPAIHPAGVEICGDTTDQDCDGRLACVTGLANADRKIVGEGASDYAGYALAGVGDVDADGYDDLLVGAFGEDNLTGAAYLVLGMTAQAGAGLLALAQADAKLLGQAQDDFAGFAVAGTGDSNGDGYDDLLIGACHAQNQGSDIGAAYLVRGPVSLGLDLGQADAAIFGQSIDDLAGWAVASAGDVNGDGLGDLLVGALGEDSGGDAAGATYLLLGPASAASSLGEADAKYSGEAAGDGVGDALAGLGDSDGDGLGDLLVGAKDYNDNNQGAAYLLLGPSTCDLSLSSADGIFTGENGADDAGASVAAAGDVNADGYRDLLVGAIANDDGGQDAGSAYLLLAPVTGTHSLRFAAAGAQLIGEADSDGAGCSVAGVGDVDGDGFDDLLIGASGEDSGASEAGAAYLVLGPISGTFSLGDSLKMFSGENATDSAGGAVAGAGDVDGDGYDDLLIGAHLEDMGGSDGGAAYLLLGANIGN